MLKVDFRLVKSSFIIDDKKKTENKNYYAVQIKSGWLGVFKYQRGGQLNSIIIHESKEIAIQWLYDNYELKPSAMRVHQHATIKLL